MTMGVRNTEDDAKVALYDSVTGFAFGPTFDSADEANHFIEWADKHFDGTDLRIVHDAQLESAYGKWFEETQAHREGHPTVFGHG